MQILRSILTALSIQPISKVLALLAVFSAAPLASSAAERAANPPCEALSGRFTFTDFHFTSATTAEATGLIWDGDVLIGTAMARYYNIHQLGNGVIHMNGRHTLTFTGGILYTCDEIRLQTDQKNPAVSRANSRLYIIGGTDEYAGATGVLHTHGSLDLFTLEGGIDFKGQVCTD